MLIILGIQYPANKRVLSGPEGVGAVAGRWFSWGRSEAKRPIRRGWWFGHGCRWYLVCIAEWYAWETWSLCSRMWGSIHDLVLATAHGIPLLEPFSLSQCLMSYASILFINNLNHVGYPWYQGKVLRESVYQSQPFSLSFSMSLLHLANVFIIFLLFLYTYLFYLFPSVSVYWLSLPSLYFRHFPSLSIYTYTFINMVFPQWSLVPLHLTHDVAHLSLSLP